MKNQVLLVAAFLVVCLIGTSNVIGSSGPAGGIASGDPSEPMIHGPRVVGTTPGRPFLFLVPATGQGPLAFAAGGLPAGLAIDPASGIITGSVKSNGIYVARLSVSGPAGGAERNLNIVAGDHKLARTPPMGWNSWNVWGLSVDDDKVRASADAMVSSGLAAHGFQYVNIDDGWEDGRDVDGRIQTNEKFPDMKALADYVHGRGLKIGIYSSPGPKTCGRYEGSYGYEAQDAATWAEWGIDYLKYDLCSYREVSPCKTRDQIMAPYTLMRGELDKASRDIVYSLCEYGMEDVWEWGPQVNGNLWRTTGDITDTWGSMSRIGFKQAGLESFAGPGHWNDPDMLVVGKLGWGVYLHNTKLSPDEQITHITLWSMLAAPLLLGCNLADLDQFTIDLLTNHDVLEIDQDPLGVQAAPAIKKGKIEIWTRPLWDTTTAVAVFNRGPWAKQVKIAWADLGLSGPLPVRDLWKRTDLGEQDGLTVRVPAHGAILLKVGAPDRDDFVLVQYE